MGKNSGEKLVPADENFLVKPPKKERSEAQKKATQMALEKLKAKREEMKHAMETIKKQKKKHNIVEDTSSSEEEAPVAPPAPAPKVVKEKPVEKVDKPVIDEQMLSTMMNVLQMKAQKDKKPKKKVVIVEESSSSEEEVVVRRVSKKKAKSVEPVEEKPVEQAKEKRSTGSRVLDILFS
jgi:hypothetical protein